jgi:hypothetical protein
MLQLVRIFRRTICLLVIMAIIFPSVVSAMSQSDLKSIITNKVFYDPSCAEASTSNTKPGSGSGLTAAAPALKDPNKLIEAINKYIDEQFPSSPFKGKGKDFVDGAMAAGINPLLIVALTKKESQMGTSKDPQVTGAFNAFGRTATDSQPHIVGPTGIKWYKWSSWEDSLNNNAPGGDPASNDYPSYLQEVYFRSGEFDISSAGLEFMNKYAPPHENDTAGYIKGIQDLFADFVQNRAKDAFGEGGGQASGKVFAFGDSVLAGAKTQVEATLKTKGFTEVVIDAVPSRALREGGSKLDGMSEFQRQADKVKGTGAIIIELGTNGGVTPENIQKFMNDTVKPASPGAKVFWVNVGVDPSKRTQSGTIDADGTNNTLQQASTNGYSIIDWSSQVKAHPEYINTDGYGVHLSEQGLQPYADLIASGTQGSGAPTDTRNGSCTCSAAAGNSGSTTLTGADNAEKIWNYLIGKGLNPIQTAGLMGNFQQESNFNPESTNGSTLGIAQWLAERRTALEKFAQDQGKPATDLLVQLDYLWKELSERDARDRPDKKEIDVIKELASLEEIVRFFDYSFERSGDDETIVRQRVQYGEEILAKYGSTTGGGTTGGGNVSCASGPGGTVVGGFSLPLERKWYDEHKDWFTKPHHDYPASDIPVPEGTPVFSMTAGKIIKAPNEGGYGVGVTIDAGNGIIFIYGHGIDGGSLDGAREGDTVQPGQLIMHSGNTGQSQGPHLHLEIDIDGDTKVCPQTLFVGIVEGNIPDIKSLPKSGCSY